MTQKYMFAYAYLSLQKRRAYVDPQGRGAKKHKTGGKGGKKKEAPTTEGVTAAVAAALAPPSTGMISLLYLRRS